MSNVGEAAGDPLETGEGLKVKSNAIFRIGDLARAYGVTQRALRFYEAKGLLHPARRGNIRIYSRRDRARLELVLLGRKVGFPLRDVKQMLDLSTPTEPGAKQIQLALAKSEKQFGRLKQQRLAIDEAIIALSELMVGLQLRLSDGTSASLGK